MNKHLPDALSRLTSDIAAALHGIADRHTQIAFADSFTETVAEIATKLLHVAGVAGLLQLKELSARLSDLAAQSRTLAAAAHPAAEERARLAEALAELGTVDAARLGRSEALQRLAQILTAPANTLTVRLIGPRSRQRDTCEHALSDAGYQVDVAEHLPLDAEQRPAAAVIVVPSGGSPAGALGMLKALQAADAQSVPVLVISDQNTQDDRLAALRAGAARHLLAPFAEGQLVTALEELTGHPLDAPYRVLVIDEDPLARSALTFVLQAAWMDVRALEHPADLLQQVDAFAPDVVVLAARESPAEGLELALLLRGQDPLLPALLLSSSPDMGERMLAASLTDTDCISMPTPGRALIARIRSRAFRHRKKRYAEQHLLATLQEREQEHLALNQHAIVSIADRAGKIIYVNDRFCTISGYTREELLGRNHRIVKSGRHDASFYKNLWRTISNGDVWQGEICNRRKDGSEYWVESTIFPHVDANGRPYRYTSIRTDVTRVKQGELELRRTRDLLERVNDAALIGTWEYWPEQQWLQWSSTTRRIHEVGDDYRPDVATAIGFYASQQDRDTIERLFQRACTQGASFDEQLQLRTAGGKLRHVRVLGLAELEHGRPLRIYGLIQDNTAQKQQEQELRKLSRIARETDNAVILTDSAGRIEWVNEGFERITGYNRVEVLGRKPGGFLQGPESDPAAVQLMRDALGLQESFQVDIVNYTKEARPYWIRISCSPLKGPDGELEGFMAIESDVTREKLDSERIRESEHHLREAQALANVGSWQADLRSGKLCWSDEVFRIFGHEPGSFTPNVQAFHDAVHPDDLARVNTSEQQAARTGRHDVVHRIVRPDGSVRHVHELAEAEVDEAGQVVSMTGTVQDVTEQVEVEQRLIAARDQAERASRAKSEFLASMSHELRTPMNAILGFAQILEYDEKLDTEQQDSVAEILQAGQHLLELINEVLDLAKIEAGRIDLCVEAVEFCPLVKECLNLMAPLAEERGIELSHSGIEGAWVRADRMRLRQALLNLLSNAIKYNCDHGRVTVTVHHRKEDRLEVQVADTGPGIPDEQLAYLFEPFNRLGAEGGDIEGTGIGLTLTRQLTEMMGGSVRVDSRVGAGSCFTLELPLEPDAPSAARAAATIQGASLPSGARGRAADHRKVLYIEDNLSNVKLVAQLLGRRERIELVTAHDPSMGMDLARSQQPDLILLDINLPGMDGYQVLGELRKDPRLAATPVVAVSANAMSQDRERGMAAGFAAYLTKPLRLDEFDAVLDLLLEGAPKPR
jgi:PAS domain S-box-containing protein